MSSCILADLITTCSWCTYVITFGPSSIVIINRMNTRGQMVKIFVPNDVSAEFKTRSIKVKQKDKLKKNIQKTHVLSNLHETFPKRMLNDVRLSSKWFRSYKNMATSWCCSFSYMAKMKPCEHALSQLFMQLARHIFFLS